MIAIDIDREIDICSIVNRVDTIFKENYMRTVA